MRSSKSYTAVEVHAEGEQGTCYLGSVFEVPGATMRDKLRYINEVDDSIRKFLCFEPRGRPQTSANLVFPSHEPGADAGFIILDFFKSPLRFDRSVRFEQGSFRLSLHGESGLNVRIQRSENLRDWQDWQTVTLANGSLELTDSNAANSSPRFYRAAAP